MTVFKSVSQSLHFFPLVEQTGSPDYIENEFVCEDFN